jgi:rhamnosyltransferase
VSVVVAVVPTYRPDPADLEAILRTLAEEGIAVVVADDASPCTFDGTLRAAAARGATLVRHRRNAGIARSLNDGLHHAQRLGADWLLTIDQDSTLTSDYLPALLRACDDAERALGTGAIGAVAAGSIDDRSGRLSYPVSRTGGVATTEEVIQTGTLWSVPGLAMIGGFDESLAIDGVDAAACVRLRARGLRIVLATDASLGHRVGVGRQVVVLGRSVLASGHAPARRTTIMRNRLRLLPEEFAQSPKQAFRTMRRLAVSTVLAVTIEEDRWGKAKASARGLLPRSRP